MTQNADFKELKKKMYELLACSENDAGFEIEALVAFLKSAIDEKEESLFEGLRGYPVTAFFDNSVLNIEVIPLFVAPEQMDRFKVGEKVYFKVNLEKYNRLTLSNSALNNNVQKVEFATEKGDDYITIIFGSNN